MQYVSTTQQARLDIDEAIAKWLICNGITPKEAQKLDFDAVSSALDGLVYEYKMQYLKLNKRYYKISGNVTTEITKWEYIKAKLLGSK